MSADPDRLNMIAADIEFQCAELAKTSDLSTEERERIDALLELAYAHLKAAELALRQAQVPF